jgi:hypothetical protein
MFICSCRTLTAGLTRWVQQPRYRLGGSGVRMTIGPRDFSVLRKAQTNSGVRKMVMGFFSREKSSRGLKLTIHLHIVSRLRMNGTITSIPSVCIHTVYTVQIYLLILTVHYYCKFQITRMSYCNLTL